ncbi:hypothetical protein BDN72DRAFT_965539 [Pluteus cervinus]|uniref:Uncharacterized protein n=1 Tax=Pluteus cervinus TaxID=181527 RepID=A0ACD3A524_9AGAR|nr:hypothetical protein BDN72DRAFT_965539 [Pluteus cervinus]
MGSSDETPFDLTIEQERIELDAKIRELEVALATLKRRRNTLSSIGKIPSDVLRQIFQSAIGHDGRIQLLGFNGREVDKEYRLQMAWIRAITHVCSMWRELALDSPSLWTRIIINSKHEIVLEMLKRSRSLPLTMSLMYVRDASGVRQALDSVILEPSHMQRMKHLELSLDYGRSQWVLDKLHSSPPANLESFSIFASSNIFGSATLPGWLFQYSSTTLRHLQVSHCTFDFQGIDGTLSLPNLRTFVLDVSAWEDITVLDHLSFPHTCMVTLSGGGTFDEEAPEIFKRIIQRIWGLETAGNEPYFRGLTLDISSRGPRFSFSVDDTGDVMPALVVQTRDRDALSFQKWFKTFPLEYIKTLRVETFLSLAHWKLLVQYCPNIISLSLKDNNPATWFASVLYIHGLRNPFSTPLPDAGIEPNVPPDQRAFLKLESLELIDFQLNRFSEITFFGCVKQRSESHIPIKRLILQKISVGYLEELAPYVDGEITYCSLEA